MKKVRLSVYLEPKVFDQLSRYALAHRQPLSAIAEAGISAFVDPRGNEDSTLRALRQVQRRMEKLARDSEITTEAFRIYLWLWLSAHPTSPEQSSAASRAATTQRLDQFMETLGQRLAGMKTAQYASFSTDQ